MYSAAPRVKLPQAKLSSFKSSLAEIASDSARKRVKEVKWSKLHL